MSLPGNPTALAERTEELARAASAISDAAHTLNRIAVDGIGQTVDAIAERGREAARTVERAHDRYDNTAQALATYAVRLQAAHDAADRADREMAEARRTLDDAADARADLDAQRRDAEGADADPSTLRHLEQQLNDVVWERARAQAQYEEARSAHQQAFEDYEDAAEDAIARITHALDDTNDSVWDHLSSFAASIGDFFAAVGRWIAEILSVIVDILVAVVVAVAIVLVVIALIAVVVSLVSLTLFPMLTWALIATLVATLLIPGLEEARIIVAALLITAIVPAAGALLLGRILSDVTAPTPEVRDYVTEGTPAQRRAAQDAADITTISELSQFAEAEGYVDQMGGQDKTVVDIKQVIGPDGVARWVVTLPSTQDWQALQGVMDGNPGATSFDDAGATNDVDSNIALMLTPELRTQYERAVLLAMEETGIEPDDEVMLVGFSQGGIMAGHLAANRSDEYNFTAVLAYGSPIDAMDIPPRTEVLSIQHPEPVHQLDLTAPPANSDHWTTISTEAFGPDGVPVTGAGAHNNDLYLESINRLVADGTLSNDHFAPFMGDVLEHHRYEWNE